MATPIANTSSARIDVYSGARQLMPDGTTVLYRLIDGDQTEQFSNFETTASLTINHLPYYDNFADAYAVVVSCDGYRQSGFVPVTLRPTRMVLVDLMLVPKDPVFVFASDADWDQVKTALPFLANGVTDAAGQARYAALRNGSPERLAALLNLTTAMAQIQLPRKPPLDYLKQIKWDDSLAQDRFFAYCDADLIQEVRTAADQGEFAPEIGSGFLHAGATASWKQVQFGEANVQLTFHENDRQTIDGTDCIVVEPDIDYYKDPAAHFLLEGFPNFLTGGLTNPVEVYLLRWIAGRHAGVPEFSPPYTLVAA